MPTVGKITVRMHAMLKAAMERKSGELLGDAGLLDNMQRRGLATPEDRRFLISELGIWAVDHAPLDETQQPVYMTDDRFTEYLRTRGRKELRADANA